MQYPTPKTNADAKNLHQRANNVGYGGGQNFQQVPQQQTQIPQQQQSMNVPQQQGGANNWNANAFDSFANATLNAGSNGNNNGNEMNNLVRDAGIKYARTMGESTFAKYMPGFIVMWRSLKYYFNVQNKMVFNKLGRLLFPFRVKAWKRVTSGYQDGAKNTDFGFLPPSKDINCPDLYIPTMGLFTFVLIIGLLKGQSMRFTPEVLYDVAVSAMMSQLLEIIIIRGGMYMFNLETLSLFELGAYTGYKYVGLCINMIVSLLFGWWMYYPTLIYTGLSMAFFMVRSLNASIVKSENRANMKATYFLAVIGFCEILLMWYEAYTGDLTKIHSSTAGGSKMAADVVDTNVKVDAANK